MKITRGWSLLAILIAAHNAQLSIVSAQGDLTPPGPPARTMKTLEQLEPRRPVSTVPITIDQPGSYYLTGNLQFSAESGHAITITVSNVTLDLMGFTLSSAAGVSGDAIRINSGARNIAVTNGAIAGNTTVNVVSNIWNVSPAGFATGINALSADSISLVNQLRVSGCRGNGFTANSGATITDCTAASNGGIGISAPSGNVTNCAARFNGTVGIAANSGNVTNSRANTNGGTGIDATSGNVSHSTAKSNADDGLLVPNGVVAFCKADGNGPLSAGIDIDATGATRTGNHPAP